jgi:DNA-binding NarL/FixJ family response regulator
MYKYNSRVVSSDIYIKLFKLFKLLSQGKTYTEIAAEFYVSAATVKRWIQLLKKQFQVNNTMQLVVKAIREGII